MCIEISLQMQKLAVFYCQIQVGPETVPTYDPQHDDAGCFVTHQSESLCLKIKALVQIVSHCHTESQSGRKNIDMPWASRISLFEA